jgi:hypothetical protein
MPVLCFLNFKKKFQKQKFVFLKILKNNNLSGTGESSKNNLTYIRLITFEFLIDGM